MSRRALIASAAIFVCGACDATGPGDSSFEVHIFATTAPPATSTESDGSLVIQCEVHLGARALGSSGSRATAVWDGGIVRWYAGLDRATPVFVDTLSIADVTGLWGSDRLTVNDKLNIDWLLWASIPFIAEPEFFFRVNGGPRRSATASAACGLDPTAPAPAPPTVSNVEIRTPSPFEPGDTLVVSYMATAVGRLFGTAVVIQGPWEQEKQVAENLLTETTRELRFVVPSGVQLGEPLDIAVLAVDAHGQTNAPVWVQSEPLVDVTPPEFVGESHIVRQYAVGDLIPIEFHVRDNHELRDLIVEIGGESFFFPLDGGDVFTYLSVTAKGNWLGAPGFAVSATDAQGQTGPPREAHPDSFRIYPLVERPRVSWTGPTHYRNAAWDDANDRLHLTYGDLSQLDVVSTATMTTLRSYTLPAPGIAVDFTQGGDTAVVTLGNRGTLAIVDLLAETVVELPLSPGAWRQAVNVTVLAAGRALVELADSAGAYLALVDIADGSVLWSTSLERPGVDFARARDRSAVGVRTVASSLPCIMVYDAAAGSLTECRTDIGIHEGVLNADATASRFLAAEFLIDMPTTSFRMPVWGADERRVPVTAFAPDQTTMYRSDAAGLTHIRISDGVVLERVPFPIVGHLFISADGTRLIAPGNDLNNTSRPVVVERVMLK